MLMQIWEKNKAALSFAAVIIGGAAIFAATTGVGGGTAPQSQPSEMAETEARQPAAPAKPVTSFADMVGEYKPDVDPETGLKIPQNDLPGGGFGETAIANASNDLGSARPRAQSRQARAVHPDRPTAPPVVAQGPGPGIERKAPARFGEQANPEVMR